MYVDFIAILTIIIIINSLLAVTEWVDKWQSNGWKTAIGEDVKNKDDIQQLADLSSQLDVKWVRNII